MEKKEECKIIQDLLPSYIDKVLHKESEKLVESHINRCEECSNILKNMQEGIEIKKEEQVKQIDYLKKIRRKGRIKIACSIILVFILIFLILYLYNLVLIVRMKKTYRDTANMENYYYEVRNYIGEEEVVIQKIWKNGEKLKIERGGYLKGNETYHVDTISYETIGSKDKIEIHVDNNTAYKMQDFYETSKETALPSYPAQITTPFMENNFYQLVSTLGAPFYNHIVGTDTKETGKPYYVVKTKETETWVDKASLRPIKSIGYTSGAQYYPNSDVIKTRFIGIDEYILKPGIVTEDEVTVPDLSDYKIVKKVIELNLEKGGFDITEENE